MLLAAKFPFPALASPCEVKAKRAQEILTSLSSKLTPSLPPMARVFLPYLNTNLEAVGNMTDEQIDGFTTYLKQAVAYIEGPAE